MQATELLYITRRGDGEALKEALFAAGCPLEVCTPEQALERQDLYFDLLIFDLSVDPELTALTELRRRHGDSSLIALVEDPAHASMVGALRLGARLLYSNPLHLEALQLVIDQASEQLQLQRALQQRPENTERLLRVVSASCDFRTAKEQLHTIIETSPVPMIVARVEDGEVLFANQPLARIFGLPRRELLGRRSESHYHNADDHEALLAELQRDGVVQEKELLLLRGDGTPFWATVSMATAVLGGEVASIGALHDIDERKQIEEALRISEARFRGLVERIQGTIFSTDPEGRLTYLSPQFRELTGYDPEPFIGKEGHDLIDPDDHARATAHWSQIESHATDASYEFRYHRRDGVERWCSVGSTVLRDEEGQVLESVGIIQDITEMRQTLNALEQANTHLKETQAQLVQSEKMASLGMLVAGIAHEINTPVGAINSMHETAMRSLELLRQKLSETYPEALEQRRVKTLLSGIASTNEVISSGAARVTEIVRRLRSFARLDEAELKLVDVHEGLEDTLTIVHHEIKHKIGIVREFGELPRLRCFPGPLNQVFLNILMNAKQAIDGPGQIVIRTEASPGWVRISFTDDGPGMEPRTVEKIFDPGFTTKGVGVGTGLGLSICYQIVKDHQGHIEVQSTPGAGTTFTVVLPDDLGQRLKQEAAAR